MPRNARKAREIERIRRDILEAAARAFTARGYAKATMEDIGREAGYAVGSLYNYFKGKAEIHEALFVAIINEMADVPRTDPAIDRLPFRQRFEWRLRQHLELVLRNRDFFTMYYAMRGASDAGSDQVSLILQDGYLRELQTVIDDIDQAMIEGAVRQGDAHDMAWFVVGAVDSMIYRWTLGKLEGELLGHAGRITDLVFRGIGS